MMTEEKGSKKEEETKKLSDEQLSEAAGGAEKVGNFMSGYRCPVCGRRFTESEVLRNNFFCPYHEYDEFIKVVKVDR